MDFELRELSPREKALLEKLIACAVHGRDELLTQLPHTKATQIIDDGTLRLQCTGGIGAPGKIRLVAEGVCVDDDGAIIAVLLHIRPGGVMSMLEIIKYDGSQIIKPPCADNLTLH